MATDIDVQDLKALIARQQEQLDKLMTAQGVPPDAVAAYAAALREHLAAQQAMRPHEDLSALVKILDKENDGLTVQDGDVLEKTLRRPVYAHPDLAYVKDLAVELSIALAERGDTKVKAEEETGEE